MVARINIQRYNATINTIDLSIHFGCMGMTGILKCNADLGEILDDSYEELT